MPCRVRRPGETFKSGASEYYNIPLVSMYGAKKDPKYGVLEPWAWTHPSYEFKIPSNGKEVIEVSIDPTQRLLDIDITNNSWKK